MTRSSGSSALALLCAAGLAGCSIYDNTDGETYLISSASGSLASWEESSACSCSLDKDELQFSCGRASDDPQFSFFVALPPANQRYRGFVRLYATRPYQTFDGFSNARGELELQSEVITHQVSEEVSPSRYRALIVHQLYLPAKRLCAQLEPSDCLDVGEGRLSDARFLCSIL